MKTKCAGCNNDFECSTRKYNFNKKHSLALYCSRECYKNSKQQRVLASCANCGVNVERRNSQFKRSKTGHVYCSKSCAVANNNRLFKTHTDHPLFKTGLSSYRQRKIDSMEKPACEECGNDIQCVLQVHHKDGNRKNNKLENLSLLCANCHVLKHCVSSV